MQDVQTIYRQTISPLPAGRKTSAGDNHLARFEQWWKAVGFRTRFIAKFAKWQSFQFTRRSEWTPKSGAWILGQLSFPLLAKVYLFRRVVYLQRWKTRGLLANSYSTSNATNPAWRKWSSVVKASVMLFSVITTNEAQSVRPQSLSWRCS